MARLSLAFFGGFDVTLDGQPVAGLKSDKVRALLAYLAVEAGRPHRRETLAGLLWPDSPDAAAFNSLRNALANLRQALGDAQVAPPFFLIARDAIRCNPDADFWLDVAQFEERIAPSGSEWRSSKLKSQISNLQSPSTAAPSWPVSPSIPRHSRNGRSTSESSSSGRHRWRCTA